MRRSYYPNTLLPLQVGNFLVELVHSGPVQLWPEMVFGVVAIVKKKPVVQFVVRAYAPCDRLVGIAPVMEEIAVEVGATVPQIVERQKEEPKFPV